MILRTFSGAILGCCLDSPFFVTGFSEEVGDPVQDAAKKRNWIPV